MKRMNVGVLVGAALVLVGFCMGWLGLRGFGAGVFIDGWQLIAAMKKRGAPFYALYLLPVGAVAALLASFFNRRLAANLALCVGGGFFTWALFEFVHLLWRTTFAGLWLTAFGALILLLAGLTTRTRTV
ncbi:MAG: hypothetical protein R3B13_12650 [Polyangiaceae bacterium]